MRKGGMYPSENITERYDESGLPEQATTTDIKFEISSEDMYEHTTYDYEQELINRIFTNVTQNGQTNSADTVIEYLTPKQVKSICTRLNDDEFCDYFEYDCDDDDVCRLTSVTYNDNTQPDLKFEYNDDGNLVTMYIVGNQWTFQY